MTYSSQLAHGAVLRYSHKCHARCLLVVDCGSVQCRGIAREGVLSRLELTPNRNLYMLIFMFNHCSKTFESVPAPSACEADGVGTDSKVLLTGSGYIPGLVFIFKACCLLISIHFNIYSI